jgi:hypothetical protein
MRSAILIVIALFGTDPAFAERAIPDDNLAYPVLIIVKTAKVSSTGSGVYLNTEDAVYLLTARHVL